MKAFLKRFYLFERESQHKQGGGAEGKRERRRLPTGQEP